MSTLIVELPDKQIQVLERAARERGTSIDEIVAELVETLHLHGQVDAAYDVTQDPLYTMEARESTAPSDLASNVDAYLYGTKY